eukprot:370165_1
MFSDTNIITFLLITIYFVSLCHSTETNIIRRLLDDAQPVDGDIPDEEYGYIDVRDGAHMFYWFYGSTHPDRDRDELPIILWLQGGPGASSTGVGNFEEIGPLNEYYELREYPWTKKVNILFIDNPVGTGFSYVDNANESLLTSNINQISSDLLECHKQLINKHVWMGKLAYWIFGESYGAKMAANFGVVLDSSIKKNEINMNFKGVTFIGGWISGVNNMISIPDYLFSFSLIDNNEYDQLTEQADKCIDAAADIDECDDCLAISNACVRVQGLGRKFSRADVYYSLKFKGSEMPSIEGDSSAETHSKVEDIMNNIIIPNSNGTIPDEIEYKVTNAGGQYKIYSTYRATDFMKDVVSDVDILLQNEISVNIWNGQYDIICNTLGQLKWIKTLKWDKLDDYLNTPKENAVFNPDQNDVAYFKKSYENLSMYFVMKAGHAIPRDNPGAAMIALCDVTGVNYSYPIR